jgi:hypothetical protein
VEAHASGFGASFGACSEEHISGSILRLDDAR